MNKQPIAQKQLKEDVLEFQRAFSVLKERIYSLHEETNEPLATILDSVHIAMGTVEEVALAKAKIAKDADELMDAIDEDIEHQGFFRGEYLEKEAKELSAQHVDLAVSFLIERVEQLATRSGLEPLYLAEKVHEAFDVINDETVSTIELERLERGEIVATPWEEVKKRLG